jgi:chromosome segregation ATPase
MDMMQGGGYGAPAPQTGVGFFGYETADEKKLKHMLQTRKHELEAKGAALEEALMHAQELEDQLHDVESREAADRATIESLRHEASMAAALREEVSTLQMKNSEMEEAMAGHAAALSKNVTESAEYVKASAQIEEFATQVKELTQQLSDMTKKFEGCDLERNKLASKLVIVEAQMRSMEAMMSAEKEKVKVANQTVENSSKIFQSTVATLEAETVKNLEALNLRDKRSFDSNKIIRNAVKKAAAMIAVPPTEGLNRTKPSSDIKANLTGRNEIM